MDKEQVSILGAAHSTRTTDKTIIQNIRDNARELNKQLEYGDDSGEWKKKNYNITKQMLQQIERNKRIEEMQGTLFLNHLKRQGEVDLEELTQMKREKLTTKQINAVINVRGEKIAKN